MITERDAQQMEIVLRRAVCLYVEAVRSVATLAHHYDPSQRDVTHLSQDPSARENSYKHLTGRAIAALNDAGVRWTDVRLEGQWVEPYRRKVVAGLRHPELSKVNEIMSRLREGLMMQLLDKRFCTWFDTEEGLDVAERLFRAFVTWDYPTVASLADEHPLLARMLLEVLGLTEQQCIAMMCLDDNEWRSLCDENAVFTRYYVKHTA